MKYADQTTTIQDLKDLVAKFVDERDWSKHHSPKNLAMNVAIEAAELMEHFVWEEQSDPKSQEVADELADVLFNVFNFATTNDIDLSEAFDRKYQKLVKKYPVEVFKNADGSLKDYKKIKQSYRNSK